VYIDIIVFEICSELQPNTIMRNFKLATLNAADPIRNGHLSHLGQNVYRMMISNLGYKVRYDEDVHFNFIYFGFPSLPIW